MDSMRLLSLLFVLLCSPFGLANEFAGISFQPTLLHIPAASAPEDIISKWQAPLDVMKPKNVFGTWEERFHNLLRQVSVWFWSYWDEDKEAAQEELNRLSAEDKHPSAERPRLYRLIDFINSFEIPKSVSFTWPVLLIKMF